MISEQELSKTVLPMKIIWLCLVLSPLFYLVIGIQLESSMQENLAPKTLESVKMGVYIVAFVILIITGYVRNYVLSRPINEQTGNISGKDPLVQRYFVSMIVALAMSESIAILGLVLYFIGKDRTDLYLFTLVAFVTMIFYFPRKEHIRQLTDSGK